MPRQPAPASSSSSTYSETSTAYSYAKDDDNITTAPPPTAPRRRRGLRQRARDVVSDLGAPPTSRQDAKDGTPTRKFDVDLGPVAAPLSAPVRV